MSLPCVSIVVPVYNAESTLERCLDSILFQDYKNVELILVNDGSTDNSLSICQTYAQKDSRVIVIDKPNSGVSESRNIGISHTSGEYLQFVDSDDWITKNATKALVKRALETQSDLVIANFYRVINDRKAEKGHIKTTDVMDRKDFFSYMMKEPANFYYGVMWNKLYRRDIVSDHDITCRTDLDCCEDFLFNMDYLKHAETFAALNVPVYHYVKTKNSLVSLKKALLMKGKLFDSYKELFESIALYDENRAQVTFFYIAYAKDSGVGFPKKKKKRTVKQKPARTRAKKQMNA